jgi:hypothetical protein
MDENRWLITVGSGILILISLVGTFSLGVYVGRHGLSQDGLRYQPGNLAQPQPAGRSQILPKGDPDVVGLIRALSPQGLQLATKEGPKWTEIDEDTQIINPQGRILKLTDLNLGAFVAVYGEFSPGNGQRLLATHIVQLPPLSPDQP